MVDQHAHFYVIAVVSNPVRYHSRVKLYNQFADHMRGSGVTLVTVEFQYGQRAFQVTDSHNALHVQRRTDSVIWSKENMINLGIEHLYKIDPNWHACAWIDADITFTKMNPRVGGVAAWVNETLHQLQLHPIVQMWSHAIDLGPNHEVFADHVAKSFCSQWLNHAHMPIEKRYGYWHTGYAWAARRDAIETLCGFHGKPLLDFAVLGSADFYMGWSLLGELSSHLYNDVESLPHRKIGFSQPYIDALMGWAERARLLRRNVGCVDGLIYHSWHGKKKQRFYNSRENILINSQFNPNLDLKRRPDGVLELVVSSVRQERMRDDILRYMKARNEDSVDLF